MFFNHDLRLEIFKNLETTDLTKVACVSKDWNYSCENVSLWKSILFKNTLLDNNDLESIKLININYSEKIMCITLEKLSRMNKKDCFLRAKWDFISGLLVVRSPKLISQFNFYELTEICEHDINIHRFTLMCPKIFENFFDKNDIDVSWFIEFSEKDLKIAECLVTNQFYINLIEEGNPRDDFECIARSHSKAAELILNNESIVKHLDGTNLTTIACQAGGLHLKQKPGYYNLVVNCILSTELSKKLTGDNLVDIAKANIDYAKKILSNDQLTEILSGDDLYNIAVRKNGIDWAKLIFSRNDLLSKMDYDVDDSYGERINLIELALDFYSSEDLVLAYNAYKELSNISIVKSF